MVAQPVADPNENVNKLPVTNQLLFLSNEQNNSFSITWAENSQQTIVRNCLKTGETVHILRGILQNDTTFWDFFFTTPEVSISLDEVQMLFEG